jgi:hypothetical protein
VVLASSSWRRSNSGALFVRVSSWAGNTSVALNTVQLIAEISSYWLLIQRCSIETSACYAGMLVVLMFPDSTCASDEGSVSAEMVARWGGGWVITRQSVLCASSRANTVISRGSWERLVGPPFDAGAVLMIAVMPFGFVGCSSDSGSSKSVTALVGIVLAFLTIELVFFLFRVFLVLVTIWNLL